MRNLGIRDFVWKFAECRNRSKQPKGGYGGGLLSLETDPNSNASPFLEEERRLLNAISERLSKISCLKRLPEKERGVLPHRDFALEEQCGSAVR